MSKYTCVTCGEKINNREEIGNHRKKCLGALEGDLDED